MSNAYQSSRKMSKNQLIKMIKNMRHLAFIPCMLQKGKIMKKRNQNNYNKLDKILELPKEICSDIPKIIITGFDEMIIENFKGILEYEEFFVRINTHIGIININGFNLNLENMTNDDIKVTGKIESMDIERMID